LLLLLLLLLLLNIFSSIDPEG